MYVCVSSHRAYVLGLSFNNIITEMERHNSASYTSGQLKVETCREKHKVRNGGCIGKF